MRQNLEDSGDLALLEAYQIFGQDTLEAPPKEEGEPPRRETRKSDRPPNWGELEELALGCLAKGKDLRALAHLGAAVLRTRGPRTLWPSLALLRMAGPVLGRRLPLVDEDAVLRTNALSAFADRAAMIDGFAGYDPVQRAARVDFRCATWMRRCRRPPRTMSQSGETRALRPHSRRCRSTISRTLYGRGRRGGRDAARHRPEDAYERGRRGVADVRCNLAQFGAMASVLKTRVAEHPEAVAGVDEVAGTRASRAMLPWARSARVRTPFEPWMRWPSSFARASLRVRCR